MNLLESPLCAAARLDMKGMVQQVSPGVRLVLGLAPLSLLGQAFEDALSTEDRHSWRQARDRVRNGAPFGVLAATLRSGGAVVLRLAADGDGLVVVLEESFEDHKARGDASLVRALLELNGSMGLAHDLSGRLVDVSEGLCTQTGYPREELVGNHLSAIEKTLRPGQTDGLWHRIQPGKTMRLEGLVRRKDGSEFPTRVHVTRLSVGAEEVIYAHMVNIEAEKAVERLAMHRPAANSTFVGASTLDLLNYLPFGVVVVAEDRRVHFSNLAMSKLLGRKVVEGARAEEFCGGEAQDALESCFASAEVLKVDCALSEGRTGMIELAPMIRDHSVVAVTLIVRDVTRARALDQMKTDFIATVSHELRTPLTSILGFARLSQRKIASSGALNGEADASNVLKLVAEHTDVIVSEGHRLRVLVDDILDISKMESEGMTWSFGVVRIAELCREAARAATPLFEEHQLEVHIDKGLGACWGDGARLMQVLGNLLSNASKFSNRRPVHFRARVLGHGVEMSVRDHGLGIAPEDQAAVFERFKQASDTLTDKPRGTGLGLPICQAILAAHGTGLELWSAPGEGSRFSFFIEAAGVQHGLVNPRDIAPGQLRVIMVSDSDEHRRETAAKLRSPTMWVHHCPYREFTDDVVRELSPDVVMLDEHDHSGMHSKDAMRTWKHLTDRGFPVVFGSLLRSKQALVENMIWELIVSDRPSSKTAALICADSAEDGIELLAHARGLGFSVAAFVPVDELEGRIAASTVAAVFLRAREATKERVAKSFRVDQSRWHLGLHMIDSGEPVHE